MNRVCVFFLYIYLSVTVNGLNTIALDLGQGLIDEWVRFFHREIKFGLSVVEKTNVSDLCKKSLSTYLHDLDSYKSWALQVWDSMDSLPAGMKRGNIFYWPGSFDECLDARRNEWKSRYCLTQIEINESNEIFEFFNLNNSLTVGICLPSNCTDREITDFFYIYLNGTARIKSMSCQTTTSEYLDSSAIAIIVVLSIFGLLVIVGTFLTVKYKMNMQENDVTSCKYENIFSSILTSFSAFSNANVLFSTDQKGDIGCLHGLRFLSMAWIILLHTYSTSINLSWNNLFEFIKLKNSFLAQIILNGNVSVDTFYCMSGLLVSYVFFKKISKTKNFNLFQHYFHRYLRLTPVYAIIIGIAAGLFPYFGSGPRWGEIVNESEHCKQNWWINLLYLSNVVKQSTMCQPHCWFLASDIQLYIFAPLILYPLFKSKYVGGAIAVFIGIICIVADALVTYFYDLPATSIIFQADPAPKQIEFAQTIYMMAYARAGPYIIGIVTGYILSQQTEPPTFFTKKVALSGWIAATVCNLCILFGLFEFISDGTIPSIVERCIYSALSRTGWAIGIAWIVFACKWGYGGPVNSILSWKIFIPLGKLTYSAYILHYNLLLMFYASRRSTMNYDLWMGINIYLGILICSFVLAIPFSLWFELPILKLEKLFTTQKSSILKAEEQNYASTADCRGCELKPDINGIENAAFNVVD